MPSKKEPGRLRISRLVVKDVLGVEESTIDLDDVTVLAGANASGKSSHMAAIRSALGIDRTSLARLSHVGSEDAPAVEVVLVGDDDREVHVSRKGGDSPEVRERVGEDWRKVPRPVEWLRQLIDVQGANPAVWLALKDEDKAAALLEALPLPAYSRAEALLAAGLTDFRLPPLPAGLHPLEELEQIEAAVFSSRTEVNRQERAEHDAADKLLAGLPAEPPEDASDALAHGEAFVAELAATIEREDAEADSALREAQAQAKGCYETLCAEIESAFKVAATKLRRDHEAKAAEIRAEAERRIAEDLAATSGAIDGLKEGGDLQLDDAVKAAESATQRQLAAREAARLVIDGRKRDLATRREELAAMRATQRSIETDRHVRTTAKEGKALAEQHAARAAVLTRGLEALKRYKLQLASALPITGLAVHFDDKGRKSLTLDGVPLDQVNRGRLAEVAVEVSLLRGARPDDGRPYLPLVLLDDAEKLDPEARTALLREIAARGSQVVAACVSSTALKVLRGEAALEPEPAVARR